MKILHVIFESGDTCDIELINNPLVEQWVETHNIIKETVGNNFLSRKGMLFYHGLDHTSYIDVETEKANAVAEINKSIDFLEDRFGFSFPYRAFNGMDWKDTNNIHRCFTTGLHSRKAWRWHGVTRDQLLALKYLHIEDINVYNQIREYFNWTETKHIPPADTPRNLRGDDGIFNWRKEWWLGPTPFNSDYHYGLERINKYIHAYEDVSSNSHRGQVEINQWGTRELEYLEVEWDTYDENGSKGYHSPKIRKTMKQYCDYNPEDYDVFFCKSITGKDYFQCYHEYDDPLEWDIENFDHINGGFTIMPSKMYARWWHTETARDWLRGYGVPLDLQILQPPALGKIVSGFENWHKIEWDHTRKNSWGNSMLNPIGTVVQTEIV